MLSRGARSLLGVLFLVLAAPAAARILTVNHAAPPLGDGASWETAFQTVQAALDASGPGDEVWVARGIYPENLTVPDDVALYGGFAGIESERDMRNFRAHPTILDGQQKGSVLVLAARVTVDGFTIRNGRAGYGDRWDILGYGGGGVLCRGADAVLANNIITGNSAADGGGILANYRVILRNNVIERNLAIRAGGAHLSGAGCILWNNLFIHNFAMEYASALLTWSQNHTLLNNTFSHNSGFEGTAAVSLSSTSTMSNNLVAHNSAGIRPGKTLRHNNVFGNAGGNYISIPDPTGTDGNISRDPRLARDGFHLQPDSPCRDAGDSSVVSPEMLGDLDGQPRIQGASVDIGADESDGANWPASAPIILHVRPTGNDDADGLTWQTARRTVGSTLLSAMDGDEVWIAEGVYAVNSAVTDGGALYGGFAGTETSLDQRDYRAHPTVLDGQYIAPVLLVSSRTVVDGFTIRNGQSLQTIDYPDMKDHGGGIMARGHNVRIANNTFSCNVSLHGGGVFADGSVDLRNNAFIANRAERGSAAYLLGQSTVVNNRITGNVTSGNGYSPQSSALYVSGTFSVVGNTLAGNGNRAKGQAGALVANGDGVIVNNLVVHNGSGLFAAGSVIVRHNCVYGNAAGNYAGIPDPTGADGNISRDPRLDAPYGGAHIQPDSPCRDAGDTSAIPAELLEDLDGQPRIQGVAVDIGADESNGAAYPVPPVPAVHHVSTHGDDADDGLSWDSARHTVQAALWAARDGDEIWVAEGIYEGNLVVPMRVALYGGFRGDETARELRDPRAHETILDGGGRFTTVWIAASGVRLDGFTVRNGFGNWGRQFQIADSGGVDTFGENVTITNNVITDNHSHGWDDWGTNNGAGGGIRCTGSTVIQHNTIRGNSGGRGGGIWCSGETLIADNHIGNNIAKNNGGGIHAAGTATTIERNVIEDNLEDAGFNGGGIYITGGHALVRRNRIIGNACLHYNQGGGVGYGGGLFAVGGSGEVSQNLVEANTSSGPSGIAAGGTYTVRGNTIVGNNGAGARIVGGAFVNNIVFNNEVGVYGPQECPIFRHNNVYGNRVYEYTGGGFPAGQDGNISEDPLFVQAEAGNYRLLPRSPCIDAGDDAFVLSGDTDLMGQQRLFGLHVDLGAYEWADSGATWAQVVHALRVAGGLNDLSQTERDVLDLSAPSGVDLADCVALARQAAGLDPLR